MFHVRFQVHFMFRRATSVTTGVNIVKYFARTETSRLVTVPEIAQQKISRNLCNTERNSRIWKPDISYQCCCSGLGLPVGFYW